jgi:hypothetical protein
VPVYLLSVTARLLAEESTAEGVLRLLDAAHLRIVRGFKDLTTNEMHNLWGLETEETS